MKRKLIIITIAALVATACSTNTQTAGNYVDDLYYWPGDDVPQISNKEIEELEQSTNTDDNVVIISELGKNEKGSKTLDNYIYAEEEPDWYNQVQAYNLSNTQGEGQDTIFIPDENNGEYVVNNYYINDQMSYADRIRRFHDPYYYDSHLSMSFNMGWGVPYYSNYHRWNSWHYDPWYASSWGYSPYYGSSWYYNRWHSPYYYSHYSPYSYYNGYYGRYYSGYYGGYYGSHYPNYYVDNKDYEESNRRSRRPNTTYSGGGVAGGRSATGNYRNNETINKSVRTSNRRSVVNDSDIAQKSATTATGRERAVVMEKRRSTPSSRSVSASSGTTNSTSRTNNVITTPRRDVRSTYSSSTTGSTTSSRSYTPSYNKPRTNTRATYNRSNNRSSDNVQRSSTRSRSSYSIPSTDRTSKSATYRSSSSKTPSKSYSTGSRSTPSRSKSYSTGSSSKSRSSYSSGSSRRPTKSYSSGSSSRSSRSSYSSGSSSRSSRSSYSSGSSSRSSGSSSRSSGSSRSSSGRRR